MSLPCDCCLGPQVLTPRPIANRPGLPKLRYRAGDYGSFLGTMRARLSSTDYPALARLKTREPNDPTLALLDAWACVGEVLTLYQERIANEGYLRTATERRSVLELARLAGYALRPGVAATVYLAYTVDQNAPAPVTIPAGARANSVPGPGEQMQAFETAEALEARLAWNALKPRLTQPQTAAAILSKGLYLKGTATALKARQTMLLDLGQGAKPQLMHILALEEDSVAQRTRVQLAEVGAKRTRAVQATGQAGGTSVVTSDGVGILGGLVKALVTPPSVPPPSARQLERDVSTAYSAESDTVPRLLALLQPRLRRLFSIVRHGLPPSNPQPISAYALRVAAVPFGHNAPLRQIDFDDTHKRAVFDEWQIDDPWNSSVPQPPSPGLNEALAPETTPEHHESLKLLLDNEYDIASDSWIAIVKPGTAPIVTTAKVSQRSFAGYGLSGKSVQLDLPASAAWIKDGSEPYATVRTTRVYAGSVALELAEEPITEPIKGDQIELGELVDELAPGRWLIVSGERADILAQGQPLAGIRAAELVMLSAVTHGVRQEQGMAAVGEVVHTTLTLARPLAYVYRRDSVTVYANVVKASHGATCAEVMGAGDAARPLQQFTLRQPPLTYVSAPTASGVASTLEVRVNDVLWQQADSLASMGPGERKYIASDDDDGMTTVVFGNGTRGARLPTGPENVKAVYRNGIGAGGNVKAGQISLLGTRPLGVKEVVNPIPASGGADREGRDLARASAPVALYALDRLVSTSDYADFSRTFGGIAKASATRLAQGRQLLVHVTVAGAGDDLIEYSSDLYRNLYTALHRYGDPYLPIALVVRERLALVVSARVRVDPDYEWETVEPKVRDAMLAEFGFQRAGLARDLLLAQAVSTVQAVPGVHYVDFVVFDTVTEADVLAGFSKTVAARLGLQPRIALRPGRVEQGKALPAQLAYLSATVPDMLLLQEIKP